MGTARATASDILTYDQNPGAIEPLGHEKQTPARQLSWIGTFPMESFHKWTVIGGTGEIDVNTSGSTEEATIVGTANTTTEFEGDVESIEGEEAFLVVKIGNEYVERIIPTTMLKARGADFEGARVKLVIREEGGVVSSEIRNNTDVEDPQWAEPDDELSEILIRLKRHLSKSKSR